MANNHERLHFKTGFPAESNPVVIELITELLGDTYGAPIVPVSLLRNGMTRQQLRDALRDYFKRQNGAKGFW